ncbi:MAG: hypothetical protein SOZ04_01330 [Bacilli bacterium]|nr:hypothetical protein [Bacilli bacterium]
MSKRKILMYSLFSLVAVSLTSVAFANWIISGIQATTSDNVSVTVGTVEDQRLSASAEVTEGAICFDAIKTDKDAPIVYGGSTAGEDLSFTIKVTVTNACTSDGEKTSYFDGINLKWTMASDTASTALTTAINGGHIIAPLPLDTSGVTLGAKATSVSDKNISATWTNSGTSLIATITFSFAWNTTVETHGVQTAGNNPCLVLPSATSEQINSCVTMLNALYSANGAKFTVTATPVSK